MTHEFESNIDEFIEQFDTSFEYDLSKSTKDVLKEAIRAWTERYGGKLIPRTPAFDNDDLPICPTCKENGIREGMFDEIGGLDEYYYRFSHCCNCGQAINWDGIVDEAQEFFKRLRSSRVF